MKTVGDMDHAQFTSLQAVIFDWAGTTVDCGCCGPVQAFVESFAASGVTVTTEEARGPMGMGKREHVAALFALPRIAKHWLALSGHGPDDKDIDTIYEHVQSSMLGVILRYSTPIPGVPEAIGIMRQKGLRIGSCTGYPRPVAEKMAAFAAQHKYEPDTLVCATDVAQSRPSPDMCLKILKEFGIINPRRSVKIGDTLPDILEGKNAGMWTIGVALSSNITGLSAEDLASMTDDQRVAVSQQAATELKEAGADFIAQDVPSCLPFLEQIDRLCALERR